MTPMNPDEVDCLLASSAILLTVLLAGLLRLQLVRAERQRERMVRALELVELLEAVARSAFDLADNCEEDAETRAVTVWSPDYADLQAALDALDDLPEPLPRQYVMSGPAKAGYLLARLLRDSEWDLMPETRAAARPSP
jgi:hypothetical protein